ncbi:MAG TPA: L-histidine N(alpha)-methyltransferase [Bryobacteraceae bacterium]|nr:L-histidine N(alpha)-methyltransferase [Bryobacteraceae bacterium]
MSFAPALDNEFAREVAAGLARGGQKTLPCRYLYDEVGSALFEAITCLPEYGLTRADARIIQKHAGALLDLLPSPLAVAELGSGTGNKTYAVLERLRERQPVTYFPIDISATALEACARCLSPLARVVPMTSSYLEGLEKVTAQRARHQTLLVLFLGSTIGNFEPDAACEFLAAVRLCLRPGDALLLGTDLVKPEEQLLAAYDDPGGVTAAFNLNLLARINRELHADFDLRRFAHAARYSRQHQRIEMHLRSLAAQTVRIGAAGLTVEFALDETICTETSHKFRPEQIAALARVTGFRLAEQWIDCEWPFAENLLMAA